MYHNTLVGLLQSALIQKKKDIRGAVGGSVETQLGVTYTNEVPRTSVNSVKKSTRWKRYIFRAKKKLKKDKDLEKFSSSKN